MLVKYHVLLGFLFSLILFFIFPEINYFEVLIIFLSSVLIDVDHYLYYIFKNKSLNLKKAFNYFKDKRTKMLKLSRKQRNKVPTIPCCLHGIEILIILFLLNLFVSKIFLFILIGFSFHLVLDLIEQFYYKDRIYKLSLVNDLFKN